MSNSPLHMEDVKQNKNKYKCYISLILFLVWESSLVLFHYHVERQVLATLQENEMKQITMLFSLIKRIAIQTPLSTQSYFIHCLRKQRKGEKRILGKKKSLFEVVLFHISINIKEKDMHIICIKLNEMRSSS